MESMVGWRFLPRPEAVLLVVTLAVSACASGSGTVHPQFGSELSGWRVIPEPVRDSRVMDGGSEVLVVAGAAQVAHFDGARWQELSYLHGQEVRDIFAPELSRLFTVNPRGALCWNVVVPDRCPGGLWQDRDARLLSGVGGFWDPSNRDDGAVFAVGSGGLILHWAEYTRSWAALESGTTADLLGVWGSAPSHAFAVGAAGTILRADFATSRFHAMASGTSATLNAIWGSGPADVYAVGAGGTVVHFDGVRWTVKRLPGESGDLLSVAGTGPNDVYAVTEAALWHFDGSEWRVLTDNFQRLFTPPPGSGAFTARSIFASQRWGVYVIGNGALFHRAP